MKLSQAITKAIDLFYIKPLRRFVPQQTFRYAACMGANYFVLGTLVYWVAFHHIVGDSWLDLRFVVMSPHTQAIFIQFVIISCTGFWLNKYVTFSQSPLKGRTQFFRYLLSLAGSLLINYIFMKLLIETIGIYPTMASPIATLLVAVYSYLTAKFFTFIEKQ
jgi:hypothetical protein